MNPSPLAPYSPIEGLSRPPLQNRNRRGNEFVAMDFNECGDSCASSVAPNESTSLEDKIDSGYDNIEIGPNDVLCGRGKLSFNHIGNRRFRDIVSQSIDDYNNAASRAEKCVIVETIIGQVATSGGSFLKMDNEGKWQELDGQNTRQKIAHAIRDATAKKEAKLKRKATGKDAKLMHHSNSTKAAYGMLTQSDTAKKAPVYSHKPTPKYNVTMHPPIDFSNQRPDPPAFRSQLISAPMNQPPTFDLYARTQSPSSQLPTGGYQNMSVATNTMPPPPPQALAGYASFNEVTPESGMIASSHFGLRKTPSPEDPGGRSPQDGGSDQGNVAHDDEFLSKINETLGTWHEDNDTNDPNIH